MRRQEGIALKPWSPPARGLLTGGRRRENFGADIRAKTGVIV
ncbi:MAG: hypothetical protein Q8N47_22535 [Bryobacterales bacterium]|nr:hypothetical protein [Bryobacterales bacterium]